MIYDSYKNRTSAKSRKPFNLNISPNVLNARSVESMLKTLLFTRIFLANSYNGCTLKIIVKIITVPSAVPCAMK